MNEDNVHPTGPRPAVVDRHMSRSCQAALLQERGPPADIRGVPRRAGIGGPVEIRLEPTTTASPVGDPRPALSPGSPGRYGAPQGGRGAMVGAFLIIAIFGFSFTAGGALALWLAVGKIAAHAANAWVMLPMGAAFLLIGVGFLIALVRGPRGVQADPALAG